MNLVFLQLVSASHTPPKMYRPIKINNTGEQKRPPCKNMVGDSAEFNPLRSQDVLDSRSGQKTRASLDDGAGEAGDESRELLNEVAEEANKGGEHSETFHSREQGTGSCLQRFLVLQMLR